MGRGSRHSKNAGTMGSESQTAGERAALGYGTVKERLGKASAPAARCRALTAQPARCRPAPARCRHGLRLDA